MSDAIELAKMRDRCIAAIGGVVIEMVRAKGFHELAATLDDVVRAFAAMSNKALFTQNDVPPKETRPD